VRSRRRIALAVVSGLLLIPGIVVVAVRFRSEERPPAIASAGPNPGREGPGGVPPEPGSADPVARSRRLSLTEPRASRAILRRALEDAPTDEAVLTALAGKLMLDESTEAKSMAARCLHLNPDSQRCKEIHRRALDPHPRDEPIKKFLAGCLENDPNRIECIGAVVVSRLREGDIEGAHRAAAQLSELSPEAPLASLSSARILSARGRYGEALLRFDEACRAGVDYACFRAEALRGDGW
jgi:tetratricopeptide (TPR) repeat protein